MRSSPDSLANSSALPVSLPASTPIPTPTNTVDPLNRSQRQQLLQLARNSIEQGSATQNPGYNTDTVFDQKLSQLGCSFITLELNGQLRGCVGALIPYQPLALDVIEHAHAAAHQDQRFPTLKPDDLAQLKIEISILSAIQPLTFNDQNELLTNLQPGIDGVIIEEGKHRATFLPSIWEILPDPELFFEQLKIKAGLESQHWSTDLKVWRYSSYNFH